MELQLPTVRVQYSEMLAESLRDPHLPQLFGCRRRCERFRAAAGHARV